METIAFAPRLLFLSQDPARVRAQLAGTRLSLEQALPLRDDVSTDEIVPLPALVHFDATLGRHVYTGFEAGGERPIGRDAVRNAGLQVVVAGERYGKGSSREHSVVAERAAGVRLVIARSFERIYRQNADNVGLWTSTDMGLADRIACGEVVHIDELLAGRDALAAAILRARGLLGHGVPAAAAQVVSPPAATHPQTLFEKIIRRHAVGAWPSPGEGGFVRADWRFIHEIYTGMCAHMLDVQHGPALALHDPATIVTFEDHYAHVHRSPAHTGQPSLGLVAGVRALSQAHRAFVARFDLRSHGYLSGLSAGDADNAGSEGISHAVMAERYALPGQLIVGTDSHTPHSGAVGCVAFGVGSTDMAGAFVSGAVRYTLPGVLRVDFEGTMSAALTAKDLVLHLLALPVIRAGAGVGRVFEFGGAVVRALSTDERATLTNMAAELGGFTGMVEPDAETVRFVRERRRVEIAIAPWMHSDAAADYAMRLAIDCSALTPTVARPGDPGNGVPLSALGDPAGRVAVDIAYGGSCTAGKREDFDHYHRVLRWAAMRGLKVAGGVRLYLQFGTRDVRDYCAQSGYFEAFHAVGAELLEPSCGACANCGPGASDNAAQVTVSAVNRNFPGRSGPGSVWLASPPTVAASAIAGRLVSFDELQTGAAAGRYIPA